MPLGDALPKRRESVLRNILEDYIAHAVPVASEAITRRSGLDVSPATVRNEMAALEEDGFITRPYSSAGGTPTSRGYRYYVESMWGGREISRRRKVALRQRLQQAEPDVEAWTRITAQMLSEMSHNMALATFPRSLQSRVRNIQLIYLHDLLVMLVLVLQEARLYKELMPLEEPADQAELTQVAAKLSNELAGLSRPEIEGRGAEGSPLEQQVLGGVLRVLQEGERTATADYFTQGLRHLLAQPEFARSEQGVQIVEALEDRRLVQAMLQENPDAGEIRVLIGEENQETALKPLGVVLAQYGVPGSATGIVGIIGPMRMEYGGTVAGVGYVSTMLSELLRTVGTEPDIERR